MPLLRLCPLSLSFLLLVAPAQGQERTKEETWATLKIVQSVAVSDEILFFRSDHDGPTGLWSYSVGQVPERRCDVELDEPLHAWHVNAKDAASLLVVHDRGEVSVLDPATGRPSWTDKSLRRGFFGYPSALQFAATPDNPKALGILIWAELNRWSNKEGLASGTLRAASVRVDGLQRKWERPLTFSSEYSRLKTCLTRTGANDEELLLAVVTDNRLTRLCPFCGAEKWTVEITDPTPFRPVGLGCLDDPKGSPVILLATGSHQEDWILMIDGRDGATLKKVPDPHPSKHQSCTYFGYEMHPASNGRTFIQLRFGMYGFLDAAGRLEIPSRPPTAFHWWVPSMTSSQISHEGATLLVIANSPWFQESSRPHLFVFDPKTMDLVHQARNEDFAPR